MKGRNKGNSRNSLGSKRIKENDGERSIDVPRGRYASFEPKIIKKGQRRSNGFDEKIISMYAHGMLVRETQSHLHEIYGVDVSPDLILRVTDKVMDDVRSMQCSPRPRCKPVSFT